MKLSAKLLFVFILCTVSGCSSSRYVLVNDSENPNYLIKLIENHKDQGDLSNKPIIIIDGVPHRYNFELKEKPLQITINEIEAIDVLKVDIAQKIYGKYGKKGGILITTRNK